MKLRLSIHDAIVDADVALEIFGLLEGKAEFIERKWQGTSSDYTYAFVDDITDSQMSVRPVSQKMLAQATLEQNN
jgi:hypothetical protein